MTVLEVENLKKIYRPRFGGNQVQALSKVTFSVEEGEYVAIMGESGSGKTTLLNMLAALDKPTEGEVYLDGKPLSAIREKDLSKFRRDHLGFVFQDFNLLDTFNLKDNILLPLVLQGVDYRKMNVRMMPIVKELGIAGLLEKYPYEVSGGQKQRAAVARALITDPRLILADEPTGSVDTKTSNVILDIFKELNRTEKITVVIVTHDVKLAHHIDRVVAIRDGRTSSEIVRKRSYVEELNELGDIVRVEDEDGDIHEELVVLDRSGRLQLPKDYMETLEIRGGDKVKVELDEEDKRIYLFKSG